LTSAPPATERICIMLPKIIYPRWYHSFRGFVFGVAVGCAAATFAYESKAISLGNLVWQQVFPIAVNALPWVVLAFFEVHFRIRRHRALGRAIDGRAAAL
jgi:hypothetical protein